MNLFFWLILLNYFSHLKRWNEAISQMIWVLKIPSMNSPGAWLRRRSPPPICWLVITRFCHLRAQRGIRLSQASGRWHSVALIFASFLPWVTRHLPHHVQPAVHRAGHDISKGWEISPHCLCSLETLPRYSALASLHLVPFSVLTPV